MTKLINFANKFYSKGPPSELGKMLLQHFRKAQSDPLKSVTNMVLKEKTTIYKGGGHARDLIQMGTVFILKA